MKKEELLNRIIARGEHSNHCHVVTGPCSVEHTEEGIFINTEDSNCVMKHLLEDNWMQGQESWTGEHTDILLSEPLIRHGDVLLEKVAENRYKYIPQIEFDPFDKIIQKVKD